MSDQQLIPIETVNASALFQGEALDHLLAQIEAQATDFEANVETEHGRKTIASMAYKVARSKTAIDDAGKELVSGIKEQAKAIDAARKKARDYLDDLKARVRAPLTEYEDEQERIRKEAEEAERRRAEEAEAARLAELERRERELREREEAIAKAEAERRAAEEEKLRKKEQAEREERLQREAEERARLEAQEAIQRAEREAAEAKERERQAAERAEQQRLEAQRQAEERARQEYGQKERQAREYKEEQERAEARRVADMTHRNKVHAAAISALVQSGVAEEVARTVIQTIAAGDIPNVVVRY